MRLRNIFAFFLFFNVLAIHISIGQTAVYWVGGSGDWQDINHWSDRSGGPGGFQSPNNQIDAIFDDQSFTAPGQEVTLGAAPFQGVNAFCNNLDFSGVTNNPSFTSLDPNLSIEVGGSIYLSASMVWQMPGPVKFTATTTGHFIQSSGQTFQGDLIFDGFNGEWHLVDPLDVDGTIDMQAGNLVSNDQMIRGSSIIATSGNDVGLDFGTSDVVLFGFANNAASFIMNGDFINLQAMNATIALAGTDALVRLDGDVSFAFGTVIFASANGTLATGMVDAIPFFDALEFQGQGFISGDHVILNLTLPNGNTVFLENGSTQILAELLTTSDQCEGDARLISLNDAGPRAIIDVNMGQYTGPFYFRGIEVIYTGGTVTVFGGFDGGNNSDNLNVTGSSQTLYWVGDGGDWNDPAHWSLTSGGPGGACIPKAVDNVIFDNNSFPGLTMDFQVTSNIPVYVNTFTFTTQNFVGGISLPSLNIIAHITLDNEEPALTITEPVIWNIPDVNVYSTNRPGTSPNTDNLFIDVIPRILNNLNISGEPEGRVRLRRDLELRGTLFITGGVEFNTNGFNVRAPFIQAIDNPVTIIANNSTITVTGSYDGITYPLTINMISGISADQTEWIFTEEESGFSIDQGSLGNITFSNMMGTAHMLVLDAIGITTLTIMNDGQFTGTVYNIDSLIFSPGHDYEVGAGVDISVSMYFEGRGDLCSPITFHTSGSNISESINLDPSIDLELSTMEITDIAAAGGGMYLAGAGSVGTRSPGWVFPSPDQNLNAQQFLGNDITACGDSVITLMPFESDELSSITWEVNGVDVSNSISYQIDPGATEVIAKIMTISGCPVNDTINVLFDQPFSIDLGLPRDVCQGSQETLDPMFSDPAAGYEWNTGAISDTINVNTTDNYSVTVTRGSCVTSDNVMITRIDLEPFEDVFGTEDSLVLCQGDSRVIQPPVFTNATFLWNDDASSGPLQINENTLPANGYYSIRVSEGSCSDSDSLFVAFDPSIDQILTSTMDTIICAGTSINLQSLPGFDSLMWSTGANQPGIPVSIEDTYSVTAYRGACQETEEVDVFVTEIQMFTLGGDVTICETEDELPLFKPSNLVIPDIRWIEASTGITLSTEDTLNTPIVPGTLDYILEARVGLCSSRDTIAVTVEVAPMLDLVTSDTTICQGESLDISFPAEPDVSYQWNTGETTSSITVNTSGSFSVTAERGRCIVDSTINVAVLDLTALNIGPRDTTLCEGDNLILDASLPGSIDYTWTPVNSGPIFNVLAPGDYSVIASASGCGVTDTISVNYDQPAIFDLHRIADETDTTICAGEILSYQFGLTNVSYSWSDFNEVELSQSNSFDITDEGGYILTIASGVCRTTDSVIVTIQELPEMNLQDTLESCDGEIETLDATTGNAMYLWSTSASTSSIDITTTGTYSVTATENNCPNTDSTVVIFNALPQAILPEDQTICDGDSILILDTDSVNENFTIEIPANAPGLNGNQLFARVIGNHILSLTNEDNCVLADTFRLTLNPTPFFILPDSTALCDGMTATLAPEVNPDATRYLWSTTENGASIDVQSEGQIYLDAFIDMGTEACRWSDTTYVSVQAIPVVSLGDDAIICSDSILVLDATTPGVSYLWNTNETTPTIEISADGTYSVTVDIQGCINSDEIIVSTILAPEVNIGMDTTICEGDMLTLSTGNSSWNTTWSTGETSSLINVSGGDTYSVTVEDNGCTDTDDIMIGSALIPVFELGDPIFICDEVGIPLSAEVQDAEVVWSTGQTGSNITVTEIGIISAMATSGDGCTFEDNIQISQRECVRFEIYRPNIFSPSAIMSEDNKLFKVTPSSTATLSSYEINIFNRWGNLMFTSNDPDEGWNGQADGFQTKRVNPGVYTYVIEVTYSDDFDTNRTDIIHGDVTLID